MVPKLHKKGSSFKGAAAYLLHDKGRAKTSDRVVWTEAHNIAVNDPDMAWRIMAATALDQDRLKQNAGVKSTGRKSDTPVLHLTLAWHPEEDKSLSPDEMKRAASGAIDALGATDHQSLVIAHNDEAHPHIHILINRVHPEDGRMLSSSKEKLNLSRWAEDYEKERGKIYCEERVENNKARDRGEYIRGSKDQHRRLYGELVNGLEQSNDNRTAAERIRQQQKYVDAQLAGKGRKQAEKHRSEWQSLYDQHSKHKVELLEQARLTSARMARKVKDAYQPAREELNRKHAKERALFEAREQKLSGRIHNTVEVLRKEQAKITAKDHNRVGDLFRLIASKGERHKALMKIQAADHRAMTRDERAKADTVKKRIREVAELKRARLSAEFLSERRKLIRAQERDRAALQKEWRTRHKERKRDWHDVARKTGPKEKLKSDFTASAEGLEAKKQAMKEKIMQRLRSHRDKDKPRDGR